MYLRLSQTYLKRSYIYFTLILLLIRHKTLYNQSINKLISDLSHSYMRLISYLSKPYLTISEINLSHRLSQTFLTPISKWPVYDSPPPSTRVGSFHCRTNWRQCPRALGVRLKESMGSPLNPSAPHWHTTAKGENFSWALCSTLQINKIPFVVLGYVIT